MLQKSYQTTRTQQMECNNYVFANVAFIKEDITNELKSSEETKTQQKSFDDNG